jgi:hypothetical protein
MLGVVSGVDGIHGRVLRVAVHRLRQLRRLTVERASMLVVSLRRGDRRWRVWLRGVVYGRIWALHLRGGHEVWRLCIDGG